MTYYGLIKRILGTGVRHMMYIKPAWLLEMPLYAYWMYPQMFPHFFTGFINISVDGYGQQEGLKALFYAGLWAITG